MSNGYLALQELHRSYKSISKGLQEVTSSVLNGSLPEKKVKVEHQPEVERAECFQ